MLVDLARNDLEPRREGWQRGVASLSEHRALQPRDAHRQRRERRDAPGRDAFDLFAAAFPAGTLVGAPKVRAMGNHR